jgi:hypothetical protein
MKSDGTGPDKPVAVLIDAPLCTSCCTTPHQASASIHFSSYISVYQSPRLYMRHFGKQIAPNCIGLIRTMLAAATELVSSPSSLQPLHLSASPVAAGKCRRARAGASIRRRSQLAASERLLSSDLDLQV